LGSRSVFLGTVEEAHASETCLTDGKPDFAKIRPFVYALGQTRQYQALGEVVSRHGLMGKALKSTEHPSQG
jgi:flavin reductase (DIM6/NTAB) family NADH-FMN oxidoreductase RutF